MNEAIEAAKERAGMLLLKKEEHEERHKLEKTDEEIYEDFQFDLQHPFMALIDKIAKNFALSGHPFVLHKEISVLTYDTDSVGFTLWYNEGHKWKPSGNALITKWLKDQHPALVIPKMNMVTKGTKLLLDAYPDRFNWLREIFKERMEEEDVI